MSDPSVTARHALPFLFPGQAQKEMFVNEALARIDAALDRGVAAELATPPPEPVEGDSYLVAAGAAGSWSGRDGSVATFAAGSWLFFTPLPGARLWEANRAAQSVWDGGQWVRASRPQPASGGVTIDAEARAMLATLCDRLTMLGIFSA